MKFRTDQPADRPIHPVPLDYQMSIMTMMLLRLRMNAEKRCRTVTKERIVMYKM